MHIDSAIERCQAFTQHFLAQVLTRNHLTEMLCQQIKQGEFGAG